MPKYWVQYATDEKDDESCLIEAPNKHAAADRVMDEFNAVEILEVSEE